MNNNASVQNWTAATFAAQGLPVPAGSNENGEPYWIIEGKQISWQEMQQFIWQHRQNQQSSGGRGVESMPTMFNSNFELPTNIEQSAESIPNPEKGGERAAENSVESRLEQAKDQINKNTQGTKTQAANSNPAASLIGQSAPLQKVKPNDPVSMYRHYQANKQNKNLTDSNAFLGQLFHKLLSRLASSTIGK